MTPRKPSALPPERLRHSCDPASLPFESTKDLEPIHGVIGQDRALEALRYGLATDAQGHHVFVRGLAGTGRMTLVRQLLEDIRPFCPAAQDHVYVHDFDREEQPRLITLPRGRARAFEHAIENLIRFIAEELGQALDSDGVRTRRARLEAELRERIAERTKPFDKKMREHQLAVVTMQVGQSQQPAIVPLREGKPVPPEQFEKLVESGEITEADADSIRERIDTMAEQLEELHRDLFELQYAHRESLRDLHRHELKRAFELQSQAIKAAFPVESVARSLDQICEDVLEQLVDRPEPEPGFFELYRVNVVSSHHGEEGCPVLIETRPSVANLMGTIERDLRRDGVGSPDHLRIRAGSLLRANGGYLILDARDLLMEGGAWPALVRTLRSGRLQIAAVEHALLGPQAALKPEPIDIDVKVVLVGDASLHHQLDALDPDFPHLFKVLADFETDIANDERGHELYAGVLARIATERGLPHFDRSAVAVLIEQGARIAGRQDRLTSRFGRLVDVAHEAAFLARDQGRSTTVGEDIDEAIRRGRRRVDLPARRFLDRIVDGTIGVRTDGAVVGQVNGLAVVQSGPVTFGFPQRITASIGPGTDGAIDIESASQLSGAIHTKGFHILGGLLRHLLPLDHPLAFRASIAFEQSYGGVDGDSASGAEFCCLLSELTGLPLRQDLAMTGAIDQLGHIQPVGAVPEKIEGFFEVCLARGLTGAQGVLIPAVNVQDLMLRKAVVDACREGKFHIYSIERIEQALELLLDRPAGPDSSDGTDDPESVLSIARRKARSYWNMVSPHAVPKASSADG